MTPIPVDDHGGKGRNGAVDVAVNDKDVDLAGTDPGLGEEGVEDGEDDEVSFFVGQLAASIGREVVNCWWDGGFVADAGLEEDAGAEVGHLRVVTVEDVCVFYAGCDGGTAPHGGLQAGEVHKIDRA